MHILGIDVAKRTLAVTLLTADDTRYHQTCENTQEGFAALDAWLQSLGVTTVHACMEATNVYWEAVAAWLHAHGHTVSVVNPARIAGYAKAQTGRRKGQLHQAHQQLPDQRGARTLNDIWNKERHKDSTASQRLGEQWP
jgi:transposase